MMASQWDLETPPPTRMRSSCNACTAAKIGCSKERPTCARCKRRKEACVYVPTRRAGRPALNKQKQKRQTDVAAETTITPVALTPPASDSSLSGIQWPDEVAIVNHPSTGTTFDDFTQHICPVVSGSTLPNVIQTDDISFDEDLFSLLTEDVMQFGSDVNSCDLSRSPGYFGTSNLGNNIQSSDIVHLVQATPFPDSTACPSRSSVGSMISGLSSSNTSWFSSTLPRKDNHRSVNNDVMSSETTSLPALPAVETDKCGCLARSLHLLQQLTPSSSIDSSSCSTGTNTPHKELSFESIISQNRATITALNDIMNCSCSGDLSLPMVLALVIMKTLGWYAACASTVTKSKDNIQSSDDPVGIHHGGNRRPSIQPPSPITMQDYDLGGLDSDRVICQLVLSELYGVQRAVNEFPRYIQSWETTTCQPPSSCGQIENITQDLLFSGFPINITGSDNLATMIERSLRQHVRKLSEAIQNKLSEA